VVVLAPHSLAGTAALRGIAAALDVDPDSDIPAEVPGGDSEDIPIDFWEARSMFGSQAAVLPALVRCNIRSMPCWAVLSLCV